MGCEDDAGHREEKLTIKHLLTLVTVLLFTHLTQAEPSAGHLQHILKATNKTAPASSVSEAPPTPAIRWGQGNEKGVSRQSLDPIPTAARKTAHDT